MVKGSVMPLIVYSELFVPADDTTMLWVLAVNVPFTVLLAFTATLPKVIFVGATASVPRWIPVPFSAMETRGALLMTASVPVLVPLPLGVKTTLKV